MKNFITRFLATINILVFLAISLPAFSGEASESSTSVYPASMASGTLPIVYINTENGAPIVDKETKIPATFSMDCSMTDEFEDFGEVTMTIKGRGNSSWTYSNKKPYKLKFDKKQSLFGLPKSKHYALLAEVNVKGLTSLWGFELGRQLGMAWAPHFHPVEVVLNGNYIGHYLLIESVKIQEGRVDIFEQEEENLDPETIPHGWLVEVDNYSDEYQITLREGPDKYLKITHKSPEILSDAQRDWLIAEFKDIIARLANDDIMNPTWTEKIDIHSLALYFIVSELQGNMDAYTGSFYFHKDLGEDSKWTAGPLWDLDYTTYDEDWIFNLRPDGIVHLIKDALRYPVFLNEIKSVWDIVTPELLQSVFDKVTEYDSKVESAVASDKARWPEYAQRSELSFLSNLVIPTKYKWIRDNLDSLFPVITGVEGVSGGDGSVAVSDGKLLVGNPESVARIVVSDVAGRTLELEPAQEIKLTGLGRGVYIIRVADKSGASRSFKHFVN